MPSHGRAPVSACCEPKSPLSLRCSTEPNKLTCVITESIRCTAMQAPVQCLHPTSFCSTQVGWQASTANAVLCLVPQGPSHCSGLPFCSHVDNSARTAMRDSLAGRMNTMHRCQAASRVVDIARRSRTQASRYMYRRPIIQDSLCSWARTAGSLGKCMPEAAIGGRLEEQPPRRGVWPRLRAAQQAPVAIMPPVQPQRLQPDLQHAAKGCEHRVG